MGLPVPPPVITATSPLQSKRLPRESVFAGEAVLVSPMLGNYGKLGESREFGAENVDKYEEKSYI